MLGRYMYYQFGQMRKFSQSSSIFFLILSSLVFSTENNSLALKEYSKQEILDFVHNQKPEFKFLDSTNVPIETLNFIYSDSLKDIRISNFPVIYSMDLDGNENQDFILYTYIVTANPNSNSSVDSVYSLNSEIVFHSENGLELVSGSLNRRQGIYMTKPLCTESAEVLCGTESPDPHSKMKSELSSSFLFL
jgi:hypothetical protein